MFSGLATFLFAQSPGKVETKMDSSLNLPPQAIRDEDRFMPAATNQQQALNLMMEWRMFLRMLEAVCRAYGWEVEYETPEDASCAIFADNVCGCNSADAWQQAPLLNE